MAQAPKPKPKAERQAAPKADKKADVGKSLSEKAPPDEPAVTAILAAKPTTPEECVRAAKTLVDLNRTDLAKGLLKKALDAKLDPQQLADLGQQVGSALFFTMADLPALQPEAKQLADAVAAAVKAKLEDSKRIAALVQQLQDPSAEKRLQALVGLQEAREAAIGPLIAVLADPARAAEHANERAALVEMGRAALPPLLAIVEQADPKAAVQAIQVVGAMKDARVALSLLRPCLAEKSDPAVRGAAADALKQLGVTVPGRAEAVGLLTEDAKKYFERHGTFKGAADGKTELWRWDAAKRQCMAKVSTPDDAARAMAASRACDAYALTPGDPSVRILYLAAMLERAACENGLDRPLDEKNPAAVEARQFGAKPVEDVLKYAMARNRPAAAAAAARLLGQIGKAGELLYQGAKPAPLVQAVQSPDRRLRMAALEAIVRLQPAKTFAGSSYVLQELGFFAGSGGFRHALVAAPSLMEARELAVLLVAAGFVTDTFTNGKELVLAAAQSPDYELALIDVTIDRPVIGVLLQQLRHDPRTASLPVGLIAGAGHFDRAERLAGLDPLAKAFARPHDNKAFRWQLDQLGTLAPQEFVGFEARERQAAEAFDLLAELGRSSGKVYDLRSVQKYVIAALYNPKLAVKAVGVLADINSVESQQALVEVASRFTLPLVLRQAAAKAFRQNTQRHGVLLTTEEIRRQYERYNQSEKLDAPTQHVLALILDCLEVGVPKKK